MAYFPVDQIPINVNWTEVAIWVLGVFGAIISGLLTWIAVLIGSGKKEVNIRLEKHETWILQQQKDLHELSEKNTTAIELIKQEQAQGQERLKIFREEFFKHNKGRK